MCYPAPKNLVIPHAYSLGIRIASIYLFQCFRHTCTTPIPVTSAEQIQFRDKELTSIPRSTWSVELVSQSMFLQWCNYTDENRTTKLFLKGHFRWLGLKYMWLSFLKEELEKEIVATNKYEEISKHLLILKLCPVNTSLFKASSQMKLHSSSWGLFYWKVTTHFLPNQCHKCCSWLFCMMKQFPSLAHYRNTTFCYYGR